MNHYTFFVLLAVTSAVLGQNNLLTSSIQVVIVGTNDIHGYAFPTSLFRPDLNQTYNYGGLEYMAAMIDTLRNQYPGSFLYLDAGDQFQGGIQSGTLVSSGAIMNDYLNQMSVDASAIGNHEFDFGPSFLTPYFAGRKDGSDILAANLRSETGQQEFMTDQKNLKLYTLECGIKIGVIGLSTKQTPSSTNAFSTNLFPAYQFLDYVNIVVDGSRYLRGLGANAVVILGHVGNDCNANETFGFWEDSTPQASQCNSTDEISLLINAVPSGTIDAVVQGHRHKFSHHFINGVPIMGTINGGYYFNVLRLSFSNGQINHKVIEGPVPVCEKVFQNLGTCRYLNTTQLQTAGALVQWQFHGVKVAKHPQVQDLFTTKWLPKMAAYLQNLVLNEVTLQKNTTGQSMLGNLITNLVDAASPGSDFVVMNEGGYRTVWYPGVIQYQHFYNMFPFTNYIQTFDITGAELKAMFQIVQAGSKGFYSTKNLKQTVTVYSNGTRQLNSITFSNGTAIVDTQTYRGVTIQSLLLGGDDFSKVMGKNYTLRNGNVVGEFRTLVKPKLISLGRITQAGLIDPSNPRLTVVNA